MYLHILNIVVARRGNPHDLDVEQPAPPVHSVPPSVPVSTGQVPKNVGKQPPKITPAAALSGLASGIPSSIATQTGGVGTHRNRQCSPWVYDPLRMRPLGRWESRQKPRMKTIPWKSSSKVFPTPVVIVNRLFSRGKKRVNPWRPGGKKKKRQRYHDEFVSGVREKYGHIDITGEGPVDMGAFPAINNMEDLRNTPNCSALHLLRVACVGVLQLV